MAITTVTTTSTEVPSGPGYPAADRFQIDRGSGSTWTRIGTNVAGQTQDFWSFGSKQYTTTWSYAGGSVNATDQIRVTLELVSASGTHTVTHPPATTAVLGATSLDAATWSFVRSMSYDDVEDVVAHWNPNTAVVSNIVYTLAPSLLIYTTVYDLVGTPLVRLRLTPTTLDRYNGSAWVTVATGLTIGELNDVVFDTHAWTISINGGTPIECAPLVVPVYPIGDLAFEMSDGAKMWFTEIQYT